MNFTVIFFSPSNSVGEKQFATLIAAEAFEMEMLNKGYTTSGVLCS